MGIIGGSVLMVALMATALAVAPWNVTGNYEVTFFLDPDTSTTPYVHHMTLTQSGSTVTGDGGYPATGGDTYHWNVTSGTQTGDSLNLTILYDLGAVGTTMHMTGTIAANGTVSGTWDDNFGGTRTGTWSMTKGVSVPSIHTPSNGATLTPAALVKVDWTDSVGSNPAFLYQYQAFSDASYTTLIYDSGMTLSASEIPTPGTPLGDYYVRVRSQNSFLTQSDWSNGSSSPYVIHVANSVVTPPVNLIGPPTNKDQCKKDGWMTFNNPTFKNQGACVSYVQSNYHAGKRN